MLYLSTIYIVLFLITIVKVSEQNLSQVTNSNIGGEQHIQALYR
nr:MAG TPA: hypothetical protein [Caudoviricetes sp.]